MEEPTIATSEALGAAEDEPPLATPHELEEIIASFGEIYEFLRIYWDGWAAGIPGYGEPTVSAKALVGSVANHNPDDVPPANDSRICLCVRQHSGRRVEHKDQELRWMLCLSSTGNRQQTVNPQLGHCD